MISAKSRFLRIIAKLYRCEIAQRADVHAEFLVLMRETEEVLGIYRGNASTEDLAFTSEALYAREPEQERAKRIPYEEMRAVEFPLPASDSVRLKIQLAEGNSFCFDVIGRVGTYRDVFEVGRYLMRVIEDISKKDDATRSAADS